MSFSYYKLSLKVDSIRVSETMQHIYIYIYIYIERERERERVMKATTTVCCVYIDYNYKYVSPLIGSNSDLCTIHPFTCYVSIHGHKLRASLSGTFLQTLPDLVTPLKGHSLSLCSRPPMLSAPSERLGY